MAKRLSHRGPDGEGFWVHGSVGLAHRRLSIVDLSERGAQPMHNEMGTCVVTFNGEIYNYQQLREELRAQGVTFRSTSDTEILLLLYERFGERMLDRLHGMFAFALWDDARQTLFFARDRIGKKPFYYHVDATGFSFASEIKALWSDTRPSVDWDAVRVFLGLQYVPAPRTGFQGIDALPPGHAGRVKDGRVDVWRYSELTTEPRITSSFEEATQEVRRLLEEAVRLRLVADVPIGAFLSGGIDSTAVVALMRRLGGATCKTFTMGFPSLGFDERREAEQTARLFKTEHYAFEAKPSDVGALVDRLVDLYDAPYADSSALPTWLLAQATSQHVKVVMTGDGGDELFGGYRRYHVWDRAMRLRDHGGIGIASRAGRVMARVTGDARYQRFAETMEALRVSEGMGYATLFSGAYFSPQEESRVLTPDFERNTHEARAAQWMSQAYLPGKGVEGAMLFDATSYLPDDLNIKMDRATMAHGLEARSPLLDQDLVAYVARLPLGFRYEAGAQKRILRAAVRDLVPGEVFTRPKRGFQVPLAEWFRTDLMAMYKERCLSSEARIQEVFQVSALERYFEENRHGKDHGNRLWMLLVLASWLERHA